MTIDIISIYDCIDVEPPDEKFVFVLAPFKDDRTKIYEKIIKPLVQKMEYECIRADDLATNTNKISEIVRQIWTSQFIIADITETNANVMYEIGYAHAMNKEVIMIHERTKDKSEIKFPFDTQHIDTIIYEGDPTGGDTLRERLEKTIDHVRGKIIISAKKEIKKRVDENEDYEYKYTAISNFQIRVSRIEYFTYHTIKQLFTLKKQHNNLLNQMNECRREPSEEKYERILTRVDGVLNTNSYCQTFTKDLINTSANFISNAWIVNKFLDHFYIFSLVLGDVKRSGLYSFEDPTRFSSLEEGINQNLSNLDFCIEALNEERKLVGLETIKDDK